MRRICLILLVSAFAAPVAALAADRVSGEGSLVFSDANGTIIVQGKGVIFGHFDQGALMVLDYRPDDPNASITVSGSKVRADKATGTYSGSDIRFLFPSGRYTLELIGNGIAVSAVGKGSVSVTGAGTNDDGTVATNGGRPQEVARGSASLVFGWRASATTTTTATTTGTTTSP
jgi:hypothetical protein